MCQGLKAERVPPRSCREGKPLWPGEWYWLLSSVFALDIVGFSLSFSWPGSLTAVSVLLVQPVCLSGPKRLCPPSESLCLQETPVSTVALKTSGPDHFGCRELHSLEPLEQSSCRGQWSSLVPMAVLLVLPHPYLCFHASHSCCCRAGA